MSRIVGRSKPRQENLMRVQFSELIVFIAVLAAIIAGVRYYFVVYRVSPGHALGDYLGAVNHGNTEAQYELIDDADKKHWFPTVKEYEQNAKQAHGYAERIADFSVTEQKSDPEKASVVKVDVTLTIRGIGSQLYQASGDSVKDSYMMRKDGKGQWKVWLEKSSNVLINKIPPTPAGEKF